MFFVTSNRSSPIILNIFHRSFESFSISGFSLLNTIVVAKGSVLIRGTEEPEWVPERVPEWVPFGAGAIWSGCHLERVPFGVGAGVGAIWSGCRTRCWPRCLLGQGVGLGVFLGVGVF